MGDGLCLFAKRLERDRFIWPQASEGSVHLSGAQLSMLLEGIDWSRPSRTLQPERWRKLEIPCGGAVHPSNDLHNLSIDSTSLLRDTTTLQAMVVAQQAEIEHLKLIIAKLRRMESGQSS